MIWDPALTTRQVVIVPAPGEGWHVVNARMDYDTDKHHIFVTLLDQYGIPMSGVPVEFYWAGGVKRVVSKENGVADYPVWAGGRAYGFRLLPGDEVFGMGMGKTAEPISGDHVAYYFVAQRSREPSLPPPPVSPPPVPPPPDDFEPDWKDALLLCEELVEVLTAVLAKENHAR